MHEICSHRGGMTGVSHRKSAEHGTISTLPRLSYLGEVPVECSYHGSALLWQLLENGVVALEGIACGYVVVGSTCGGLPQAIGPCGRTFPNGDSAALASVLHDLLTHQETWNEYFVHAKEHLDAHRPSVVTDRYLAILALVSNVKALK